MRDMKMHEAYRETAGGIRPSGFVRRSMWAGAMMGRRPRLGVAAVVVVAAALFPGTVRGDWPVQSFELKKGWNAIYLELDPTEERADDVFADLPIESVWRKAAGKRRSITLGVCEDAADPSCLAGFASVWRVWFPANKPHHSISTLRIIRGGAVYLIQMEERGTLRIRGRPSSAATRWSKGFNLVGFHVVDDPGSAPTFQDYLSASSMHENTIVFEVGTDGAFLRVTDPAEAMIKCGRGYWVSASGDGRYDGPIEIDDRSLRGITFASGLTEHTLRIVNPGAEGIEVMIANEASIDGTPLPVMRYGLQEIADGNRTFGWTNLSDDPISIGPRSASNLRLAVNQREVTGLLMEGVEEVVRSVLSVRSKKGFQRTLPLEAEPQDRTGLWVGSVTVDSVAWLTGPTPTALGPTLSSEFTFRIIIHNNGSQYRIMQEVALVLDESTDPNTSTLVLATSQCSLLDSLDSVVPRISTAAFSLNSPENLDPTYSPEGDLETLKTSGPILVEAFHPLNPFVHRYNPLHTCEGWCLPTACKEVDCTPQDNPACPCQSGFCSTDGWCLCSADADCNGGTCSDDGYCTCDSDTGCSGEECTARVCTLGPTPGLPCTVANGTTACGGGECGLPTGCVEVSRDITLTFEEESDHPTWGVGLLSGTYAEEIMGLHREPVELEGKFELRKVSSVVTLCPQ